MQGPISTSDTFVPGTGVGCTTPYRSQSLPEDVPTWDELTGSNGNKEFRISFDMQATLYGSGGLIIPAKSGHDVVYKDKKWYKKSQDGLVHLYNGFDNGNSGNLASQRVSILGLVLDYNDEDGTLYLTEDAYEASDIWHSPEAKNLVNMSLAFFNAETIADIITPESPIPCNVHWSNINRMAIDYCLKFSASSTSTIFVVLAAVPRLIDTWYYVRMARDEASIHKVGIVRMRREYTVVVACMRVVCCICTCASVCMRACATDSPAVISFQTFSDGVPRAWFTVSTLTPTLTLE